ncbi:MAG: hypothetical protein ABI472_10305 [Ginsengibacter sp.]
MRGPWYFGEPKGRVTLIKIVSFCQDANMLLCIDLAIGSEAGRLRNPTLISVQADDHSCSPFSIGNNIS